MKFQTEEIFLGSVFLPLMMGLTLLLANVKSPHEIFSEGQKVEKQKLQKLIKVKDTPKVESHTPLISAPSLSQSLMAPAPSLGTDLKSLSAGLVSSSSSGSGIGVSQGDTQVQDFIQGGEGQSRPARAVQVINPIYPQSAQARGMEGHVIVEIVVTEKGVVSEVRILNSEPSGLFDQAAIDAIRKWTFESGLDNGRPVVSRIKQKVNFELD